jgi:LysR family transcriptional regulator, transcriptional activator of nhaA
MEWLNYHHFLYFWVVAKEGSIVRASEQLRLAQPTISGQIHRLEEVLGQKLFARRGRNLVLTDEGRTAFRYADEIFSLGREFLDSLKGRPGGQQLRLVVGVSDVLAKSIVHRILEPAFRMKEEVRVICREDRSVEAFMADLAVNAIDVVLSDTPAGPGTPVRTFSHPLGECGLSFFAAPALARSCRRGFPASLDGTRFLLPASDSTLRRQLDEWFDSRDLHPKVVAELDDAALTAVLGEAGLGLFVAPDVLASEIRRRYKVQLVGRIKQIRQRFFAISVERKIRHPAVAAICEVARQRIFD